MSARCGKSYHRGDVDKVAELFVDKVAELFDELESGKELEAALRRELIELYGFDTQLGHEAGDS